MIDVADWYRNRTWDPTIEEEFEARFSRARKPWSRWQALKIQALLLRRRHPDAARRLLVRSLELPGAQPSWATVSAQLLGELAWQQGAEDEAMHHLRHAMALCPPAQRTMRLPPSPERQLVRILWLKGEHAAALGLFEQMVSAQGAKAIPPLIQDPCDPLGEPYVTPAHAAESLLVGLDEVQLPIRVREQLAAFDLSAISALDRMLVNQPMWNVFPMSWTFGRHELPAFLGMCMVRQGRARWVAGTGFLDWRLNELDPWETAWPLLWQGAPLGMVLAQWESMLQVGAPLDG